MRHFRALLQLVVISIIFVVCTDIVLRAYFWFHDQQPDSRSLADAYNGQNWVTQYFREDQQAQIVWNSYVYWRHKPFKGQFVNVDENGLRYTFNKASPESERQIFFFGGSTLWGTGARDEYTIPSIVSKTLGEAGCRDIYVKNFGEIGYVSTQEVVTLMLALRTPPVPVMVVFYDGINDTWSAFQNGSAGMPLNEDNRRTDFNMRDGSNWYLAFVRQLGLYRLAEMLSRRAGTLLPGIAPPSHLARDVLTDYISNIREVNALSREYGFSSYYFWQPVIYTKPRQSLWEINEVSKGLRGVAEFFDNVYGIVHQSPELMGNSGFADISDVFRTLPESVFIDTWHTSEEGNRITAEAIAKTIIGRLRCT